MAKEAGEGREREEEPGGYLYLWEGSESKDESKGKRCKCCKLDGVEMVAYLCSISEDI
jgi:hypothetical protein